MTKQQIEAFKKITPGPWSMCGASRGGCSCHTGWSITADAPIFAALSASEESYTLGEGCNHEQAIINGTAIAALPDLLAEREKMIAALKRCTGWLDSGTKMLAEIENLIAQAEGDE